MYSIRLWNLRVSPHYIMNTQSRLYGCLRRSPILTLIADVAVPSVIANFDSAVIATAFSPANSMQYFGCSADGEIRVQPRCVHGVLMTVCLITLLLQAVEMSVDFLSPYVNHRLHAHKPKPIPISRDAKPLRRLSNTSASPLVSSAEQSPRQRSDHTDDESHPLSTHIESVSEDSDGETKTKPLETKTKLHASEDVSEEVSIINFEGSSLIPAPSNALPPKHPPAHFESDSDNDDQLEYKRASSGATSGDAYVSTISVPTIVRRVICNW